MSIMKSIKELFAIIPSYPGLNICLVDDGRFEVIDDFLNLAQEKDATVFLKDIKNRYQDLANSDFLKIEKFDFDNKRYNLHSVLYDFIFLCCDIDKIDKKEILTRFYRVLKNAGDIYLFSKENPADLKDILESINYVAVNEIDTMGLYHVMSAKKMHGWMKV